MPLASDVFPTADFSASIKTLDVKTDDFANVGTYRVKLEVFYAAYAAQSTVQKYPKDFLIEVKDYCQPTSIDITTSWIP